MLPLSSREPPSGPEELRAALTDGLRSMFDLPADRPVVEVDGAGYPTLARLRIDLTGASVRTDYRPAAAAAGGPPGLTVARLEMVGRPLHYGPAALVLELTGEDVRLEFARDELGRTVLNPVDASCGHIASHIRQADLQALILSGAQAAAAAHGVTIEQTDLAVACPGGRSVALDLRVAASKKVVLRIRTVIRAHAYLVVDEALNATFSGLRCEGEGVVGALVKGLIQHQLQQWEGRTIPLTAFSLGRLRLHHLHIGCNDGLNVEAAFGTS